ncbi:unnamed protein product [Thelazia callipaeda]|uniref:RRP15-like protein n=1 Tax=Thelazia callipaeda TaxID=103827 RepID=A0A0N5DA75_THECL|nr:unnamed protein product [Thelazia callipaeda]
MEKVNDEATVSFDDKKNRKKVLKRTSRQLHAQRVERNEEKRKGMVLPDPIKDRERERNLVRLATKGVVQLFDAVTERQIKLRVTGAPSLSKKRRLRGVSPESFKRRLAESVKDKWHGSGDEMSQNGFKKESDANSDLDTSEIKTEPESESE